MVPGQKGHASKSLIDNYHASEGGATQKYGLGLPADSINHMAVHYYC